MADPALWALGALAAALAYLNGLHDASNAVSTSIATRTMSQRGALALAAVLNIAGALLGIGTVSLAAPVVLDLIGGAALAPQNAADLRAVLGGAVIAALAWGVLTWWRGMPSSTWHAVYGGLAGGALAVGLPLPWAVDLVVVALSILLSPLVGGVLAYLLVLALGAITARGRVRTRHLRVVQTLSASAVAAGHGLNDVRLPVAIVAIAAASGPSATGMPLWAAVLIALALGAGTFAGGRRIIRTLATRLTDLSTAQGLAAETSAAVVLYAAALAGGAPVSTTHTVTAGIVASGLGVSRRAVRWRVVRRIVVTWVLTPIVAALVAAVVALALRAL
ncbi:inorganic phosphate transporter [Brachybacterium huguangmaarense]